MILVRVALGVAILGLGFGVVERVWPSIVGHRWWRRRGVRTDLAYFLYSPTAGKVLSGIVVFAAVMSLATVFQQDLTVDQLRGLAQRDTVVGRQAPIVQVVEMLLVGDLIGYWTHRAFHTFTIMWRAHAVHHSSTELDWLSSARVHPINELVNNLATATPLILMGFSPAAVGAYIPFVTLYAIMLHANVSWTFGPLRALLASPVFHRWHHSLDATDRNFAGLFPFYDRLFGTYYMPAGELPARFGLVRARVPESFLGQMAYPLRRRNGRPGAAPA